MKFWSLVSFLILASCTVSLAQQFITMKDNARLSANIVDANETSLILKEGAVSINLVKAIQYTDSTEVSANAKLINYLIKRGIIVSFKETPLRYREEIGLPEGKEVISQTVAEPEDDDNQTRDDDTKNTESLYFGIGLGLDYGGIGTRITFLPQENIGLFVSAGYIVRGLGYNVGLVARAAPNKKVVPTLSFMYGYNGVIIIEGAPEFDKTYFGTSIAFGVEIKSGRSLKNFLHLQLVVPQRNEFDNDIQSLKNNPSIEIQAPPPILISIGYHFGSKSVL
jgi:hypothetical protein